ncbi:MAG: efflux RND transporter periplasmic adaptor subunit [Saprospiraceae bacterium]|jgi:membrane fusion protein (multidrug efflux system)|nr:efflux RND transporter periplasmic adaptor subunit [Saprospiraceae bacterium]
MKKILSYLIPAVILVGIFGGIALKLKKNKTVAEERVFHFNPEETPVLADSILSKTASSDADDLVFTGTFEPFRETKISAEIQGKINHISVDAGSIVTKGQTLVQLDDALLQLQLQSVEVQIEGLTADVNRYSILAKADAVQGVQLEKAQLGLKSAQIQRATIQEQINKSAIKAPFGGVIFAKLNEVGGFAAPGVPLVHLLEIDQMKFTVNVAENDLKYFKIGQSHNITADVFPDKKIMGKVSIIAGKANVGNGFPVQFTVNNFPNHALRAGMFGKIELSSIDQRL